jgi:hypothetical protein
MINAGSTLVALGNLSGSGNFSGNGSVEVFAEINPGNSPGTVTFDVDTILASNATLRIELGGLVAGTEYDQVIAARNLTLNGSLTVDLWNGFTLEDGYDFTIVRAIGDVSGRFSGLDEGGLVGTFGEQNLLITYFGGAGNDVVLFTQPIPEPSTWVLIIGAIALLMLRMRSKKRV